MKVCTQCGEEKPESEYYWVKVAQRTMSKCKTCFKAYARTQSKEYYKNNKEKVMRRTAAYTKAHSEQRAAIGARYYKRNREEILKKTAQHYERTREAQKARGRLWRKNNLDRDVIKTNRRRARKKSAEGTWSLEEWNILKKSCNFVCLCCKKKEPHIKLVADHVIPLAKGGSNHIKNIQPLCIRCNSKKHTKIIDYRVGIQDSRKEHVR